MTGVHPEEWLHFRSVAGMAKCYELILMHGYEPNDALAATRHIVTPPPAGAPATPTTQAIGGARPQSGGIAFGGSPWGPAAQLGSQQPWGPVLNTTNSIAGATQYYSPVPPPPWDLHG